MPETVTRITPRRERPFQVLDPGLRMCASAARAASARKTAAVRRRFVEVGLFSFTPFLWWASRVLVTGLYLLT